MKKEFKFNMFPTFFCPDPKARKPAYSLGPTIASEQSEMEPTEKGESNSDKEAFWQWIASYCVKVFFLGQAFLVVY